MTMFKWLLITIIMVMVTKVIREGDMGASMVTIIITITIFIFSIVIIMIDHHHLAVKIMGKAAREATGVDGKLVEATTVTASFELTW